MLNIKETNPVVEAIRILDKRSFNEKLAVVSKFVKLEEFIKDCCINKHDTYFFDTKVIDDYLLNGYSENPEFSDVVESLHMFNLTDEEEDVIENLSLIYYIKDNDDNSVDCCFYSMLRNEKHDIILSCKEYIKENCDEHMIYVMNSYLKLIEEWKEEEKEDPNKVYYICCDKELNQKGKIFITKQKAIDFIRESDKEINIYDKNNHGDLSFDDIISNGDAFICSNNFIR